MTRVRELMTCPFTKQNITYKLQGTAVGPGRSGKRVEETGAQAFQGFGTVPPRSQVPEYFSATWRSNTPALTTTTPSPGSESTTREIVIPSFLAYSDEFEEEAEDEYATEDAGNAEVLLQRPESSLSSAPTTTSDTIISTLFGTQPSFEATTRNIV